MSKETSNLDKEVAQIDRDLCKKLAGDGWRLPEMTDDTCNCSWKFTI